MTQHTPWNSEIAVESDFDEDVGIFGSGDDRLVVARIEDADGKAFAEITFSDNTYDRLEANIAVIHLIVTAVNSHKILVARLRHATDTLAILKGDDYETVTSNRAMLEGLI